MGQKIITSAVSNASGFKVTLEVSEHTNTKSIRKHYCYNCGTPVRRTGIRRASRCPYCGTRNDFD
nr:MAG TPA: Protein kinase G rubredoxin domain [Caudoviricetes sp.]